MPGRQRHGKDDGEHDQRESAPLEDFLPAEESPRVPARRPDMRVMPLEDVRHDVGIGGITNARDGRGEDRHPRTLGEAEKAKTPEREMRDRQPSQHACALQQKRGPGKRIKKPRLGVADTWTSPETARVPVGRSSLLLEGSLNPDEPRKVVAREVVADSPWSTTNRVIDARTLGIDEYRTRVKTKP